MSEKSRWAKLAGLPKQETKQQLDENVVGVGAVNQIFPVREPQAYETAFEHFLGEMYDSKAAERDDADHIDALEKDMEYDAIKEDEGEDFDYVNHDYEKLKSLLTKAAKTAMFNVPRADNIDLEDMSENLERYIDELDEIGGFEKY